VNVAAIDCGTLSTRMLIAGPGGVALARWARITGLGEGVDANRALSPGAVSRTLSVLGEYGNALQSHGVGAARMVGTSALRDASNRGTFVAAAEEAVGVRLELLSGAEEAVLSFRGASADLRPGSGPWLVVDIGGGSTELARGDGGDDPEVVSLDLGCVRVSERFLAHDPPMEAELAEARRWAAGQLAEAGAAHPSLRSARTLVGLAGTVSALSCWAQGLTAYDRDKSHHSRLSRPVVRAALSQLSALPAASRAGLPGIEPARAPLIVGGVIVLDAVMGHFGFDECLVSEADILDGLALGLLERPPGPDR
jgi:exopolyphosphatase/guanosine-5'-triphosphate,3'-diphosphate pyrophosphatase